MAAEGAGAAGAGESGHTDWELCSQLQPWQSRRDSLPYNSNRSHHRSCGSTHVNSTDNLFSNMS